ncbi:uncharacterized protein LOC111729334 isoform X2 [Pteropus vampyrus]|uniref:Uncharacterized protein LOC111729334 isoform X2 n=1 Tax=Pteropus vampyrus TaxID=132908 RepID=A0A6P6BM19_PTEVA|nr:uncharacterized protein LOC111729334 isoform X2 [Pteropus vampyrus]
MCQGSLGPQYRPDSLELRPLRRAPGWPEMQAAAGKAGRASRAAWSGSFLLTRPRVSSGRAAQGPSGAFPTESGVYGRLEGGWEGPEGSWETRLCCPAWWLRVTESPSGLAGAHAGAGTVWKDLSVGTGVLRAASTCFHRGPFC